MSLKQQTISGVTWSFFDNAINQTIQFFIGVILARLLSPNEFGLIGMLTIFISVSQAFIDSGFSQALIRKKYCNEQDYNTVFIFNIAVAFLFYIILFFSSKWISTFFNEPKLIEIIKVMALGIIINSFGIVQLAQLTKDINIKTQTKISVVSNTIAGLIAIYLAFTGFGVWSLVWRTLISNTIRILFLWYWVKWRPGLKLSLDSFKEMFSFGSKYLGSVLLHNISENIYYLVIGKYFSAQQLGYYTRSLSFSNLLSFNINHIISRVSYPILSKIQDDDIKLKAGFKLLIKDTMFITFFALMILAAIAEPLILTLIGEKWRQSIPYLQLLCFASLLIPLHLLNLNILLVKGRSDRHFIANLINKIFILPVIYLGIRYGIYVLIIGIIIQTIIAYCIIGFSASKLINYSVFEQLKDILPNFLYAVLTGIFIYTISQFVKTTPLFLLILQTFISIIIVILIAEKIKMNSYLELKNIIKLKLKH